MNRVMVILLGCVWNWGAGGAYAQEYGSAGTLVEHRKAFESHVEETQVNVSIESLLLMCEAVAQQEATAKKVAMTSAGERREWVLDVLFTEGFWVVIIPVAGLAVFFGVDYYWENEKEEAPRLLMALDGQKN